MSLIVNLVKNKVFLYVGTRYMTYGIQFLTSLLLAFNLGPERFGIWNFILLFINTFNIIDFGISNSINVLLVQDRDNKEKVNSHIVSALIITLFISIAVLAFFLFIFCFDISLINKYEVTNYLPFVAIIVILVYYNKLFSSIFRTRNKLLEVSIYQSSVPVLLLIAVLFASNNGIFYFIIAYFIGNFLSLLIFILRSDISLKGYHITKYNILQITNKGFWLFLYNSSFYLIFYISSLCVSINYIVEDYGKFNFSYTLSHAVVLLIDAFGFIIFPKMIYKLNSKDPITSKNTIDYIRTNYITFVHLLIYLAFPLFYLLSHLAPQYSDVTRSLCFSSMALLPYADCFGINTYLIAQNQERRLSIISIISLLFGIISLLFAIYIIEIQYDFVYIVILLSYCIYTFLCSKEALKKMEMDMGIFSLFKFAFPLRCSIVFLISFLIVIFFHDNILFLSIPLFLYLIINYKDVMLVIKSMVNIFNSPNIVDIN